MANKHIHIITGGTVAHIAPHLALCAPAYGSVGRRLAELCHYSMPDLDTHVHRTKMAGGHALETNEDVAKLIDGLKERPDTKIIFMPVALCDFEPFSVYHRNSPEFGRQDVGKQRARLETSRGWHTLEMKPAEKIIKKVREGRKDIFLVGFKTTKGASEDEQYIAGLHLLKGSSCNLVLANDLETRKNMIITPEEARYPIDEATRQPKATTNREAALYELVDMVKTRSHLTFTRSTVIDGQPVPWSSELVPPALREVVDYCIKRNAYKPFRGATVGHFAVKIGPTTFLTSRRKTNFNDLETIGLVRVETDGPDTVLAYGSKPSVGGQSQRIVFEEHPEYDCIVHFHCPIKPGSLVPIVSQREYECGSHQCGQNTSRGLKQFGSLMAVYLDQHGPNILFNRDADPGFVKEFIEQNFDLEAKTGGYVTLDAPVPPKAVEKTPDWEYGCSCGAWRAKDCNCGGVPDPRR